MIVQQKRRRILTACSTWSSSARRICCIRVVSCTMTRPKRSLGTLDFELLSLFPDLFPLFRSPLSVMLPEAAEAPRWCSAELDEGPALSQLKERHCTEGRSSHVVGNTQDSWPPGRVGSKNGNTAPLASRSNSGR